MKRYDIIVLGGGTAGMIAATASARMGARTLLVEREGFVGGTASYGLPFLGFFSGDGEQVVGGLAQELVDRMISTGGCKGHMRGGRWREKRSGKEYHEFALTPFDPECLKYAAQEMIIESKAELLLQSTLTKVQKESDIISSILVITAEGIQTLEADFFIDCSGDAVLTWMAGFPTEMRGRGKMQNVTNVIRIGNVDSSSMLESLNKGRGISGLDDWHIRIVRGQLLDGTEGIVHIAGHAYVDKDRPPMTFTGVSWRKEEMSFNITRTVAVDPTNANDINCAEIQERRNIFKVMKGLRENVPGFSGAYLVASSCRVGIREGRRIHGVYTMTEEDVLSGSEFEDGIACGAYPIDIHDPEGGKTQFFFIKEGGSYSIPYRCLIPKGSKNLLVAGRCVSTTGKALGSVRLMSCCMATGQAAGSAAAIALKEESEAAEVDIGKLRKQLLSDGAILKVG